MRERLDDGDAAPSTAGIIRRSKDLGEGLVVAATAPDGVIEAIEDPAPPLLPRRPVAPGELLAHRRVPGAVRGLYKGMHI